jgi:hypothetical protein
VTTTTPPNYTPPDKGSGEPETVHEARRWQTRLNKYVKAGICHRCAGQAANGHRDGWANVRPPCGECWPTVNGWASPTGAPSGWHSLDAAKVAVSRALGSRDAH